MCCAEFLYLVDPASAILLETGRALVCHPASSRDLYILQYIIYRYFLLHLQLKMFIFVPFFFLLDLRFQLTYFSICYFYIILYFIYILVFGPKLDLKQHT